MIPALQPCRAVILRMRITIPPVLPYQPFIRHKGHNLSIFSMRKFAQSIASPTDRATPCLKLASFYEVSQYGSHRNSQAFGLRRTEQAIISNGFIENDIVCIHGQSFTTFGLFVSTPCTSPGTNRAFPTGLCHGKGRHGWGLRILFPLQTRVLFSLLRPREIWG